MTALRRLIARARRDEGVSLAELLVAIMVFGIVLTVVSTTFVSLTKATAQARFIDANTPMRRMGDAHELDGALLLLATPAGSFLTGQSVTVDGGWTAR